jgi:hypothetical protein
MFIYQYFTNARNEAIDLWYFENYYHPVLPHYFPRISRVCSKQLVAHHPGRRPHTSENTVQIETVCGFTQSLHEIFEISLKYATATSLQVLLNL